jgi:hypothetical protein
VTYLTAIVVAATTTPPSYQQACELAVSYRQAIRSCALQFRWRRSLPHGHKGENCSFQVWVDGRQLRIDRLPHPDVPADQQQHAMGREISCRNCLGPDLDTLHTVLRTAVYTVPRGQRSLAGSLDPVFDPRAIGMACGMLYDHESRTLSTAINNATWTNRTVTVGADGLLLLAATVPGWGTARCWIDPARGHNPVRFEEISSPTIPGAPKNVEVTRDIELAQDAVSGRWFPSRLRFRATHDGKPHMVEDIEVVSAEVDRPIDPKVFSLAGFGLPIGELVFEPGATKEQYWDGQRLVPNSPVVGKAEVVTHQPTTPPRPATPAGWPVGRWLTAGGAVAVALVGVWLLRRAVVGRR